MGVLRLPDTGGKRRPLRARRKFCEIVGEIIVNERARLKAGNRIAGPALIFEYSATTAVPPGYACVVDGYRNLLLSGG